MFELLQAYETARHEKNTLFRFIYTRYVRHRLRSSFFIPFKNNINGVILNRELIDEFNQFYDCTHFNNFNNIDTVITGVNKENPYMNYITESRCMIIYYDMYRIVFRFAENVCDIDVERPNGKTVSVHPENKRFYTGFFAEIIIMAIYNYCVTYIYGKHSDLYINDDRYIEVLKSMFY